MTLIVSTSLMYLIDPLLIKWLIDRVLPKKDFRPLLLFAAGFLGIYACRLALSALAGLVSFPQCKISSSASGTVGGLVASYSFVARLFDPLSAAVEIYSRLNRMSASIRRILEVIELAPTVSDTHGAIDLGFPIQGRVKMKDVSFSYGPGNSVLHDVNIRLESGEKVALVGVNGNGKSTIAKLVARLYDPQHGAVYIDGIDVRNVRLESLRTRVCYVMQEAILFDRSLKANLLLGSPTATMKDLRVAIEIADVEEALTRLPKGWDAPLSPRGNVLSGGERQRVALARRSAGAALLLLDESTSAVDVPSERRIFQSLARHFSERATF